MHVFIPQEFEDPVNAALQNSMTAKEIHDDMQGPIDGFCSGIGTGGAITDVGEALKEADPNMLIRAVELENAVILFSGSIGIHIQIYIPIFGQTL